MTAHLAGFDVSHYQPPLDALRVGDLVRRGYAFAGIKLSEGDYQTDPHFNQNRAALRAHGVPRWLYHEATSQPVPAQLDRIMRASGGYLYPRERIALVLGDFSVSPTIAAALQTAVAGHGPLKRLRGKAPHRPAVLLYANLSNWRGPYAHLTGPKIVAAYPGDDSVWQVPDAVIHQWSDHDPATGGDADHWRNADRADLERFFLQ